MKIRFRNWIAACNGSQIQAVDKEITNNPALHSKASHLLFNNKNVILVGNTQIHETELARSSSVQWNFLKGRVGPRTVHDLSTYTKYATYSANGAEKFRLVAVENQDVLPNTSKILISEGAL